MSEPPSQQAVSGTHSAAGHALLGQLVRRGLHGQLRTGNLLTGQLYVALDFFPNASPAQVDPASDPLRLPTVPNTLDELQLQVADIAKRLDQVPFDDTGNNQNSALTNATAFSGSSTRSLCLRHRAH
jgi:paraquat-inducible protein B